MKVKRLKKAKKHLAFYINNYKFRQPYQVLVDGTFCFHALANKTNIREQIPKYLQGEVKLLTTSCIAKEVENLGHKFYGALTILKNFPLHKYIVATQDATLQGKLKLIPGVPTMYLHGPAPILAPPSEEDKGSAEFSNQVSVKNAEVERLKELKESMAKKGLLPQTPQPSQEFTKVKRKKGPNPLSCKKKQKKPTLTQPAPSSGKVRKRQRVKVSAHIKEALKQVLLVKKSLGSHRQHLHALG
ncbi:Similar to UTP23: rRNA-processing protein UTP23 homolog (Homo sapiens) [Cotesia congregata]|uniref:Similar to UTP23: rRNA-processing protein UTP23 homolog (Homo sapiens) n=1 Tax=Cotesia congregata TaxID=51543 RepID=A0A8J2MQK2_COTCN|nr:Similar to UTP23: rRNA-processing protein UTP23 homolog (Homo sapiens) [Cotesia congregata]